MRVGTTRSGIDIKPPITREFLKTLNDDELVDVHAVIQFFMHRYSEKFSIQDLRDWNGYFDILLKHVGSHKKLTLIREKAGINTLFELMRHASLVVLKPFQDK